MAVNNVPRVALPLVELALAVGIIRQLSKARESVKLTARPTGLLPIFLLIDAVAIEPNIREADPFRKARNTWRAIAENNIKPLRGELEKLVPIKTWDGDAATSFNAHMRNRFLPAMEELESLAKSMGDLCDEMATGMDEINKEWLVLLIKTATELLMLSLVPLPSQPVLSNIVLGMFLVDVGYLCWKMRGWFSGKAAAVGKMEKQTRELAANCFDDTQALEDNRNLLRPHFTMAADNWSSEDWSHHWHYNVNA
jgi:hypothetical protein